MSDERLIKILKHEANNHGPEDHKHQAAALLGNIVMELDALRSHHNALVDAVKKMFAAQDAWARKGMASIGDWAEGKDLYDAARAEVDRLLLEESK